MIYRFCGLDLQMCGKWRRSARGGEVQRRTKREKGKQKRRTEAARRRDGAYPHLFSLDLAEKVFGRSLAEKASFGHRWAENGPVRPPSSRSYYFRPGPRQQRVFGPSAAEKPTSAMAWPKTAFSANPGRQGHNFAFLSNCAIVSENTTKNMIVLKKNPIEGHVRPARHPCRLQHHPLHRLGPDGGRTAMSYNL